MLSRSALSSCSSMFRGQLSQHHAHVQAYSSSPRSQEEELDIKAARDWFKNLNKDTIPAKIGTTAFSRSSGPGGQKVNKTSSKATTIWPLCALLPHVPKALHQGLRASRYYVASSDSISIQCDTDRSQSKNKDETWQRLTEEITRMYKSTIPGETSVSKKKRVDDFHEACRIRVKSAPEAQAKLRLIQKLKKEKNKSGYHFDTSSEDEADVPSPAGKNIKADNEARIRMKKLHSSKKRARTGGGQD